MSASGTASSLGPLFPSQPIATIYEADPAVPLQTAASDSAELLNALQEHALADDQHDLPDDLNVRARKDHPAHSVFPLIKADEARAPSPALKKPHKPPRLAGTVA